MAFITKFNNLWLICIFPIFVLTGVLMRINAQSLIYLIMLLVLPMLYPINMQTLNGRLKAYLIIMTVISGLFMIGQLSFQVVLLSNKPYGSIIKNCSFEQNILEEFGFYRLDKAGVLEIIRIILPDILIFVISIITVILNVKVNKFYTNLYSQMPPPPPSQTQPPQPQTRSGNNYSQQVSFSNEANTEAVISTAPTGSAVGDILLNLRRTSKNTQRSTFLEVIPDNRHLSRQKK